MSYQELPVQMHVNYPDFVKFMLDCKLRQPPSALEVCFLGVVQRTTLC